jgi:hypothetical protein
MPGGGPLAPGYELYVGGGPKPGTGRTPIVSFYHTKMAVQQRRALQTKTYLHRRDYRT